MKVKKQCFHLIWDRAITQFKLIFNHPSFISSFLEKSGPTCLPPKKKSLWSLLAVRLPCTDKCLVMHSQPMKTFRRSFIPVLAESQMVRNIGQLL